MYIHQHTELKLTRSQHAIVAATEGAVHQWEECAVGCHCNKFLEVYFWK